MLKVAPRAFIVALYINTLPLFALSVALDERPSRCPTCTLVDSSPPRTDPSTLPNPTLAHNLFPAEYSYSHGFTTASGVSLPGVSSATLSDKSLNVIKIASGMTHNVVKRAGKTAWEAIYPAGSYSPSHDIKGGFGFYVNGPDEFRDSIQGGATEVLFSYSVAFQAGWQWVKGGKLPGGFGGIGSSSYGCSGGRQEDREECFDLRLMWREKGAGELYSYLPMNDQNDKAQLAVPPQSFGHGDFGYSVGRGSFTFPVGQYVAIAQRIRLNDPRAFNGEVQVWANGEKVIDLQGISMRSSEDSVVQGMHFQTFFGGSSPDWASPVNQTAWFADISGAVINGECS